MADRLKYEGIVEVREVCPEEVVNRLLGKGWVLLDFAFINYSRPDGSHFFDIVYVLGRMEGTE